MPPVQQALSSIDLLSRSNRSIVDDAREHSAAVVDLEISELVLPRLRYPAQLAVSPG
ncbi:hypothetical protein [Sciscionella sediminilitoris]|uniref:hypothetical protein n=1 Tax=Sciscionella sediminilitoris TaxID=1445613 RepID=UPI0012E13F07|nr:hypothetical protein [Sciscionella sp. SE31]